jgi:hypothetical protein
MADLVNYGVKYLFVLVDFFMLCFQRILIKREFIREILMLTDTNLLILRQ